MQASISIRVIGGEHKGKTGEVIGRWQAKGTGRLEGKGFSDRWLVEFEDGSYKVVQEAQLEVIEPE